MEAYLDNSATTVCCKAAIEKIVKRLTIDNGSGYYGFRVAVAG